MKTMSELNTNGVRQVLDCTCASLQTLPTYVATAQTTASNPKRLSIGRLVTLATASLVVFAQIAPAQTWQTVDDFLYVAGLESWNFGVVVAPSGTVFASGSGDGSGGYHGLVMASADSGNTWSAPLDDFVEPGFPVRYDAGIACDSAGNLYVPGSTGTTSGAQLHWLVRRGALGGTTWATVDDFAVVGANPQPNWVTVDTAGNVYVAGVVQYTNGVHTWTVRKGLSGASFSTVDSFAPGGFGNAQAIFAHATAGIFAAGYTNYTVSSKHGSSTYSIWTVRRSLDGGATWTTVDNSIYGQPRSIGSDAVGDIYVVGATEPACFPARPMRLIRAINSIHALPNLADRG
jgi:hypothetical protein